MLQFLRAWCASCQCFLTSRPVSLSVLDRICAQALGDLVNVRAPGNKVFQAIPYYAFRIYVCDKLNWDLPLAEISYCPAWHRSAAVSVNEWWSAVLVVVNGIILLWCVCSPSFSFWSSLSRRGGGGRDPPGTPSLRSALVFSLQWSQGGPRNLFFNPKSTPQNLDLIKIIWKFNLLSESEVLSLFFTKKYAHVIYIRWYTSFRCLMCRGASVIWQLLSSTVS